MLEEKTTKRELPSLMEIIDRLEAMRGLAVYDSYSSSYHKVTAIKLHGDRVVFEFEQLPKLKDVRLGQYGQIERLVKIDEKCKCGQMQRLEHWEKVNET